MVARTDAALPRIVELLRVSGQGQADRDTPADQRAALDKLREAFPGILVERIDTGAVRAVSGAADLNHRPDLRRLAELARARAFDELRVRHLDRLTRHTDPRERFAIFGMVQDAGAVIRDASGHVIDPASEVGEVDYFLQTWMAAKERKRIRERTMAGRHRKASGGVPVTGLPYGRTYDRERGTWGIDETEAAVYRRLFSDVLDGKSLRGIARALNEAGIPSPRGGTWQPSPIRDMIAAPNAVGRMTSYGHAITCPAIVDEATQAAALAALAKGRSYSGPHTAKHEALLRKVAKCGGCGRTMHIAKTGASRRVYYVCAAHREPEHDAACGRFYAVETVDAAIRDALRPVLSDPEELMRALRRPAKRAKVEDVEDIRADLDDLAKREEKLVRLASKGIMSEEVYERQAQEVARLRAAAHARLSVAQAEADAVQRASARAQDIEAALREARKNISKDDFAGWRRVVELLFTSEGCSVRVMPEGDVKMDGLLPVTHPSGDTITTCSSPTTPLGSPPSCRTSIRWSPARPTPRWGGGKVSGPPRTRTAPPPRPSSRRRAGRGARERILGEDACANVSAREGLHRRRSARPIGARASVRPGSWSTGVLRMSGEGETNSGRLMELIRRELVSVPLEHWGFFFPCHVAVWRFIEEMRPGAVDPLKAYFDREPVFEGRGATWFCEELGSSEPYLRSLEAIMYPITRDAPASVRHAVSARGFFLDPEIPPIDRRLVDELARTALSAVDDAVAGGRIR